MIYPKLSDGTIDWCVMCKHNGSSVYDLCCECEYPENSDDPPTKYEPKPMTNYDRIRAMSVEELAEFMNCGACPPGKDVSELCHDEDGGSVPDMCNLCWFNWLKQEAER